MPLNSFSKAKEQHAASEEAVRLAILGSYDILDTAPEKEFDALTKLAAYICHTPIAFITLIDKDRQWFKSSVGMDATEVAREISFCQHTIRSKATMEVPDAQQDARFQSNPFVTGDPHIRYYCGVPLTSPEGSNIGSLCVIDLAPTTISEHQKQALQTLAGEIMARLELRRQKKQLEVEKKKLAESEKRYKALVDNNEGYIFTHDLQGKLLSVNPKMARALAYKPEELLETNLQNLLTSDKGSFHNYLLQIQESGIANGILQIKNAPGEEKFWVYRNFKYTDDEGNCYVICSAQDITDKEIAQQLLEKAKTELELKVESRTKQLLALNTTLTKTKTNLDTFIYRASHDLLGPLCSLKGLLNVARQDHEAPNHHEYLRLMYHTVEKLENILNSLLSYSNNTHYSLLNKPVDFQKIVSESIHACTHIDFYNRIQFQTDIKTDGRFWSDEERIRVIFKCLISNSITFQNFSSVSPFIKISVYSDAQKATIHIQDNGIGISAKTIATIFDIFSKSAVLSKGPGLGLFIVKEVINKLNGTIEVTSTEAEGTLFVINIPNKRLECTAQETSAVT
ncbi:ATP-binding protein [Rhodocytophaga aerolata]|uniref:histidine kinase n=1 Tax=Rhodocytophaga aerolata TaxID=455078 RepID=A0ABT8R9Q6_9BACT|nr:ATP-binding protein [Rhodocytophaga aerolata]MDO1447943.1 ATP-binding protein [Rhodocytophaga aerolata]